MNNILAVIISLFLGIIIGVGIGYCVGYNEGKQINTLKIGDGFHFQWRNDN